VKTRQPALPLPFGTLRRLRRPRSRRYDYPANIRRYRERNLAWVDAYLRTHPCVDCGEPDLLVLEFDHVRGQKIECVRVVASRPSSLAALQAEVAKCEVRCANCHTRVTYARRQRRTHAEP
jgi:hypothetical protein